MAQVYSQVLKDLEKIEKKKVKVAVSDMDGILRGKYIHVDKFLSAVEKGFGFCNVIFGWDSSDSCYRDSTYTGWHSGYPDALAKLDLTTYRQIPWDHLTPFFLADFVKADGSSPLEVCPRQLLKKIISQLENQGYQAEVGFEFEWFNFKETAESLKAKNYVNPEPLTPGMFGYSLLRSSQNSEFFNQIMDDMYQFNVPIEGLHTETGPGVYEAAIHRASPLEAADRAVLFKTGVKEIAQKYGIMASFMARWHNQLPGCSGHIHQSLVDSSQRNLFASTGQSMTEIFKSYLAGQLRYLPEVLPLFAPTVNSYKRLVEGFWAPTRCTWGVDNRTCALRVILGGSASRVEVRLPGADINPYLALAGALACGLQGIKENLQLTTPQVKGSGYDDRSSPLFAKNLYDATLIMRESRFANALLGETFVQHFAETRFWEWQQSQEAVTDWELKRYFEII